MSCGLGYQLSKNFCLIKDCPLTNCKTCQTAQKCSSCLKGYVLNEGVC